MLPDSTQTANASAVPPSTPAPPPSSTLASSAPPPPRISGSLVGTSIATSSTDSAPAPPATSSSSPPAPTTSTAPADATTFAPRSSPEVPPTSLDHRVCRICFGDDDDSDELGRLLAPCLCRGTARYVHQDCLRSWREADKLNSFYVCGQCGARYRFRQTAVTRLLGGRYATVVIGVVIVLLSSFLTGFFADPLMRLANEDALDPQTGQLPFHYYDDVHALADAVRETTSTVGYLVGDCTWSSPRELVRSHLRTTVFLEDGIGEVKEVSYDSRAASTGCGDRWAVRGEGEKWGKDDRVRREDWATKALLHLVKGATTAAWGWAFACRTLRLVAVGLACAHYMRWTWARGRAVPDIPGLVWCLDADVFKWNRHKIKQARVRGQLFSTRQLFTVVSTVPLVYRSARIAHGAAGALVKRALAGVEDLVLDLDGEAALDIDKQKVD
ncbi:hypothetical protein JCM3775_003837 [Rhodotorula graminis]